MGNIPDQSVICKCLDLLDIGDFRFLFHDYRVRKLTLVKAIKILLEAQCNRRESYEEIAEHLRASKSLQEAVGLSSISSSQLSRKVIELPTWVLQSLFVMLQQKIAAATRERGGIPGIGRLSVLDSTILTLPQRLGEWAYCSKTRNAVKIHTRLVVADRDTVYPDRIITSTADIADSELALELVESDDAIHVMDRGYIDYNVYAEWVKANKRFVARIQQRNRTEIVNERVVHAPLIMRDADAAITVKAKGIAIEQIQLRLVEFSDEQGRSYRVVTNVMDLSAEQISEIYRNRWLIELFFKWLKQHLRLVKLHSAKEPAIWNQIYLALIAYSLVMLVKLELQTSKRAWDILRLMRLYGEQPWGTFYAACFREKERSSSGRRKKGRVGRPRKHPKKLKGAKIIVR